MKKFWKILKVFVLGALGVAVAYITVKNRKYAIRWLARAAVRTKIQKVSKDSPVIGFDEYTDMIKVETERIKKMDAERIKAEFMARFGVKP